MAAIRLMVAIVVTSLIGFSSMSIAEENSEDSMSIDEVFELVAEGVSRGCNASAEHNKRCFDLSVEACEDVYDSSVTSCKADLESDLPDKVTKSNMSSTVTKIGMCAQRKVTDEIKGKSTGAPGCPEI